MEKQLERIAEALEEIAYNLTELKGQFEVTNRMYTDTTGNVLSEMAMMLHKKFDEDFERHLRKN